MKNKSVMKLLALALSVLMMVTSLSVTAFAEEAAAPYDKWDGTFDTTPFDSIPANNNGSAYTCSPVIIDSAEKLAGLAKLVSESGVKGDYGAFKNLPIYITVNIDLGGHNFPMIGGKITGGQESMFSGLLEGRLGGVEGAAVTIANLTVADVSTNNAGFIGNLRGGAVKNLTFVNAKVGNTANRYAQGIVVGYASKACEISGITVIDSTLISSNINYNDGEMGAIIGKFSADAKATGSHVLKDLHAENVTISWNGANNGTKKNYIGGLVGTLQTRGTAIVMENCSFSGKLVNPDDANGLNTSVDVMGGLIGRINKSGDVTLDITLKNCHYNGSLAFAATAVSVPGVLVGLVDQPGTVTMENCLITGTVPADGGLVEATANNPTITVTNCYSTAAVHNVGVKGNDTKVVAANALANLAGFSKDVWVLKDGVPVLKTSPAGLTVEDSQPQDPDPSTPSNPNTGDSISALVALMAVSATALVVLKKKEH